MSSKRKHFGFSVIHTTMDYDWDYSVKPAVRTDIPVDTWGVTLPHQCEAFKITGGYYSRAKHEDAVRDLQDFIAQAQVALASLMRHEEISMPEDDDLGDDDNV